MNVWDILILLGIAAVIAYALFRKRRKPGCCGSCAGCGVCREDCRGNDQSDKGTCTHE